MTPVAQEEVIEIIDQHIARAEANAADRYGEHKWLAFGHWKAVGVYLRTLRRQILESTQALPKNGP